MKKTLLLILLLYPFVAHAQFGTSAEDMRHQQDKYAQFDENGGRIDAGDNHLSWGRDTTRHKKAKVVPIGVHQWVVEPRLGTVVPAENKDTTVHMFQYYNCTEGKNGEYSFLGNLGAPRLSRIYMNRHAFAQPQFLFLQPFDFFLDDIRDFRFSNTLSPLTNLAYHKVGSTQNGQERVRAYFASNINKVSGIGFKLDYLYGRGYYNSAANSMFGGTLFGYYLGDRYNMHAWVNANHSKMGENGGIEDDKYLTDPQSFPQSYRTNDIPTLLTETWNRNDNETYYLTQRYNLGKYHEVELPDSLKPVVPSDEEFLKALGDSLQNIAKNDSVQRFVLLDSLRRDWEKSIVIPTEFIPVSSIIHTLEINTLRHTYYSYKTPSQYYTNMYYGNLNKVYDKTKALTIRNTVGLAMREGFNKWAAMGITLFGTHEFRTFNIPTAYREYRRYSENNFSVGGELARTMGSLIHYNVNGDITLLGEDLGQFNVDGKMDLNIPMGKRDTLQIDVHGFVKNLNPGFYYRHYHSQFAWWDNNKLSKEFKTRIEGTLAIKRTRTALTVGFENVQNYTHFAMQNTYVGTNPDKVLPGDYSHNVAVRQHNGSLRVFMAQLKQDIKLGPLHWDNEVTYQKSSDDKVLPLPMINVYTNLYLSFKIAKVLSVELGGDCRYFTKYYAPDYSPIIGQFATQDANNLIKIGNYPIVNIYANLHIKHCRLYAAMHHVNQGSGFQFWAPHYGMDPRAFHFGVSWNFFN